MKGWPARQAFARVQSGLHRCVRPERAPADREHDDPPSTAEDEPAPDSDCRPSFSSFGASPDQVYRAASAAIRRVLGPGHADGDDLIQTTLERVVRSVQTGQFSGDCSLLTWVTIVARHLALDERRARQTFARTCLTTEMPLGDLPTHLDFERQLEARSVLDQVTRILVSMDRVTVDIIVLHDCAGHDLAEIADGVGLSIAAAQSRLVRGRKELQRRLRSKLDR